MDVKNEMQKPTRGGTHRGHVIPAVEKYMAVWA
jgi:hypothetical protein